MFGGFGGILPLRLGGLPENGWDVRQHARMAADVVALKRSAFLFVIRVAKSGSTITIEDGLYMHGVGAAHAPDSLVDNGDGDMTIRWSSQSFTDEYDKTHPFRVRGAVASMKHGTQILKPQVIPVEGGVRVCIRDTGLDLTDGTLTIAAW